MELMREYNANHRSNSTGLLNGDHYSISSSHNNSSISTHDNVFAMDSPMFRATSSQRVKIIIEALEKLGGKATGVEISDWIHQNRGEYDVKRLPNIVNALLSSKKYSQFFTKDSYTVADGHKRAVWRLDNMAELDRIKDEPDDHESSSDENLEKYYPGGSDEELSDHSDGGNSPSKKAKTKKQRKGAVTKELQRRNEVSNQSPNNHEEEIVDDEESNAIEISQSTPKNRKRSPEKLSTVINANRKGKSPNRKDEHEEDEISDEISEGEGVQPKYQKQSTNNQVLNDLIGAEKQHTKTEGNNNVGSDEESKENLTKSKFHNRRKNRINSSGSLGSPLIASSPSEPIIEENSLENKELSVDQKEKEDDTKSTKSEDGEKEEDEEDESEDEMEEEELLEDVNSSQIEDNSTYTEMIEHALQSLGGRATGIEITNFINDNYTDIVNSKAKTWRNSVMGCLSANRRNLFAKEPQKATSKRYVWRLLSNEEETSPTKTTAVGNKKKRFNSSPDSKDKKKKKEKEEVPAMVEIHSPAPSPSPFPSLSSENNFAELAEGALHNLGGRATGSEISDWIMEHHPSSIITNKKKFAYTINGVLSSKKNSNLFQKEKTGQGKVAWKLVPKK
eukprot:TRINITY_DN2135_c1_g1_i2.p1 TRINITY_DN2135_c1_g1~~TRINITY_DN2135_c1_g1_i2.p1  ORF type:complete len:619 (+),score=156.22 TRINITY_DN2135_c1_g1_i2:86-1942(+)